MLENKPSQNCDPVATYFPNFSKTESAFNYKVTRIIFARQIFFKKSIYIAVSA